MTVIQQLTSIPTDFDNPEEVTDCANRLCRLASDAGLFLSDCATTAEVVAVRQAAAEWLREVDLRIDRMTPAAAFSAICSYDIIHRIARQTPAPADIISRQVLRAFDALIHGDTAIDRYHLFRQITVGLSRRDPAYLGKLLQWHSLCLDRWHKEFRRMLTAFRPAPRLTSTSVSSSRASLSTTSSGAASPTTYDLIQRATLLLESDLWAFEPTAAPHFKRQVFDLLRPRLASLSSISSPDRHDRSTLHALDRLLTVAHRLGYLTDTAADSCRTTLAHSPNRSYASASRR